MLPDEFSDLLRSRRSTRDFLPTPIPPEVMDRVLEDARECASWSNTRPYVVAIATGERLKRLQADYTAAFDRSLGIQRRDVRAIIKAPFTGALPDSDFKPWKPYPKELRGRSRKIGKALYEHMGIERGDRAARDAAVRRNLDFFGAPTVMWFFVHKKLLPFSAMDVGILLQTVMLSAQAQGLATCPLGLLSVWRGPVDKEFEIPKHYKLITGLALGYASDHPVNDFRAEHPPLNLAAEKPEAHW